MTDDTQAARLPMTAEQLAVLADDIADMAECFVDARDAKSLRNSASNLANLIRIHVTAASNRAAAVHETLEKIRALLDAAHVDTVPVHQVRALLGAPR